MNQEHSRHLILHSPLLPLLVYNFSYTRDDEQLSASEPRAEILDSSDISLAEHEIVSLSLTTTNNVRMAMVVGSTRPPSAVPTIRPHQEPAAYKIRAQHSNAGQPVLNHKQNTLMTQERCYIDLRYPLLVKDRGPLMDT